MTCTGDWATHHNACDCREAARAEELAVLRERLAAFESCNRARASAEAEVERLTRQRDEARANYQWMVERAADQKLDGYRELGARAAAAENACDALRQWQYEVADGIGYLNRPEGHGGYDVADAGTIVQAFKQMERRVDTLIHALRCLLLSRDASWTGGHDWQEAVDQACKALDGGEP